MTEAETVLRVFNKHVIVVNVKFLSRLNSTPLPRVSRYTLNYTILFYTTLHYTIVYCIVLHYTIIYYTNSTVQIHFWEIYGRLATKEVIFISHLPNLQKLHAGKYIQ